MTKPVREYVLTSLRFAALLLAAAPTVAFAQQPQQAPLPATDVTGAALSAFIDAMPKNAITDASIKVADVGGYHVGIFGVFRPKSMPGDAIAHETRTSEVYYILEGSGTLVTGGTIMDVKPAPAGRAAGPRGDRIEGGVSRKVTKGDIIVIPGRTPHWFSSLDSDIRYMIIRPDPDGRLPLK